MSFVHSIPVQVKRDDDDFIDETNSFDLLLDNSGKIDFKEFLQAINITSQGTPDKKLDMAFRMYDCNGDGSIDETEMRRIISVSQ